MKKDLLLALSLGWSIFSFSQSVTRNVNFDNYKSATDNDFKNYFYEGIGFTQSSTGGITGGSVTCPDKAF